MPAKLQAATVLRR